MQAKLGAYPKCGAPSFTLDCKYQARVEVTDSGKNTSLLTCIINLDRKKFSDASSWNGGGLIYFDKKIFLGSKNLGVMRPFIYVSS